MLCLQTRFSSKVDFYRNVLSTIPEAKQILPVFIFDLSVKFLTPPFLGGVFLSVENELSQTTHHLMI
jgi:hypothetical protein